jgi:hypothetical protein
MMIRDGERQDMTPKTDRRLELPERWEGVFKVDHFITTSIQHTIDLSPFELFKHHRYPLIH